MPIRYHVIINSNLLTGTFDWFSTGLGRTCPDPSGLVTIEDNLQVPMGKGCGSKINNTSLLYNEYPFQPGTLVAFNNNICCDRKQVTYCYESQWYLQLWSQGYVSLVLEYLTLLFLFTFSLSLHNPANISLHKDYGTCLQLR